MRLAAYIRVSRVGKREGPSFISPAEQRGQIEAWAKAHGHSIAETLEDLDQPGSTVERPGLTEAMRLAEERAVQGIVVAKLNRFGRSIVHQAALLERLHDAGGTLYTVSEGIDTSTSTGRMIAGILGAIAEWELDRIAEGWESARSAAVERGVHISGHAPAGYVKGEDGVLLPSPSAPVIRELFERRVGGASWGEVARWMSEQGVETPHGNTGWTVATVRRVIANRVYLGEARAGKMVNPTAHEPIVSASLYEAANRAKGLAPGRSGRASGLLSGILRCAGCRYAMKPSMGTTRHGKAFLEYRCKSGRRETAGRCESPAAVKANVIEPFVLGAFWAEVSEAQARRIANPQAVEEAEAELRKAEAERDAALDTRLADALGGAQSSAYIATIAKRQQAVEVAQREVAEVKREASGPDMDAIDLRSIWPDLPLADQRRLLASVLDCVFVRRAGGPQSRVPIAERAYVCAAGTAPALPVRGRRWVAVPFDLPVTTEAVAENRSEG